jgi:hypothetical protein
MIGSRGYRIAEPPRTSRGRAHSLPSPESFHHLRGGPAPRARAPPATGKLPRADEARLRSRRVRVPDMALGQRRHPPAQSNHAPPETDYGTQPKTERSYGMTTKTTSARAQCKGSVGPSSCGVARAGGATPACRGSEP